MANQPLQVIKTVSSLPAKLSPNVFYLVRVGAGYDLYATDTTGSNVYKINISPSQLTQAVDIANGGTGANTAAQARTNLGLKSAATYDVGTTNGQVVTNGSTPTFNGVNLGNGRLQQYIIPRASDFYGIIDKDFLDEFAFFDKRKGATVISTPIINTTELSKLFLDDSSYISYPDTTSSIVFELDSTQQPITAKNNGQYQIGLTFRSAISSDIRAKIELFDKTTSTYTIVLDNSLVSAGFWLSPFFSTLVSSNFNIEKIRITLSNIVINSGSVLLLQRLMLYHVTSNWDNWRLHRSGGEMYGTITPVVASNANALNVVDGARNTLAYIRGDGTASLASLNISSTGLATTQTNLGIDKVVSANTRLTDKMQEFPNVFVGSNGQLQKTQFATWLDHAKMYNGLQPNGSFQMGDGTGWKIETSGLLTRDTTDFPFGAQGCLKCIGGNAVSITLDKIAINPYMLYRLSCMFKYEKVVASSSFYFALVCYDVDNYEIKFPQAYHIANTVTTLAQDLKIGDTKIYLTSMVNWVNSANWYQRGFKFYNYTDSRGYLYDPTTMPYSRYVATVSSTGWWDNTNSANFDIANNVITLSKPWTYRNPKDSNGTWLAGTKIAQSTDSASYMYPLKFAWMKNQTGVTDWQYETQQIGGINISANEDLNKFRAGTAQVAPMFMFNYGGNATGDVTKVSHLYFEKI